jgi:hypothetical protein
MDASLIFWKNVPSENPFFRGAEFSGTDFYLPQRVFSGIPVKISKLLVSVSGGTDKRLPDGRYLSTGNF